ncbi:MAG: hypothetical protein HYX42_04130 [Polaromonas sp.]|uniref:hypothetical protein n=1 Tax=Polaromonas sp. TaxID=1869339 RepID=UPI0025DB9130|nr:hypothetical protein [Polaromonas sp.]MBI2725418.1 hypothetical protein [Polaromonas sp.]
MNCKPGDLAIVVGLGPNNNGRIVEVVRHAVSGETVAGFIFLAKGPPPFWLIKTTGTLLQWDGDSVTERVINDRFLRPIRDQPGQDETLTWAPVPGKLVTA